MNGIINVYKPCGMSSNFVLTKLKKQLNIKKLGHLGTLDPLACGVLPVMINKGTKLFDFYLNKNKVYRAVFSFGVETDTLDSEGNIIKTSKYIPDEEKIKECLNHFVGKISQIPPNFSAKSVNGKRAYDLARKGETINLAPKEVEIFRFELISQISKNSFLFEIACSSGTYIRSLARDFGNFVGSCAFMSALIRTKSGNFDILKSTYYKNLTKENCFDKIIGLEELLSNQKRIDVEEKWFKQISNGVKLKVGFEDAKNVAIYCKNQLIGIGNISGGMLCVSTNLQV